MHIDRHVRRPVRCNHTGDTQRDPPGAEARPRVVVAEDQARATRRYVLNADHQVG